MSKDSVKYLNEKCLLTANVAVPEWALHEAYSIIDFREEVKSRLGRILGDAIIREAAEFIEDTRPEASERVFQAEVYVLNRARMRHLYQLMREEIRQEAT